MSSTFTFDASNPESPNPETPREPGPRPLAHVFHTLLLVTLLLLNSWFSFKMIRSGQLKHHGVLGYVVNTILEIVSVGYVWLGLRLRKIPFREVIGRRWKSLEDFALDIAIAAVFWFVSLGVLAVLQRALGMMSKEGVSKKIDSLQMLAPHTLRELAFFLVLAVVAGICEEIVFRGYLQKQFTAWFHNLSVGVIVSALIFGASHGYQGVKLMVVLAVYGVLFGILAALRKSILPGMIAHAWQDSIAGVGLWFLMRHPELFPFK